jgi:hypothetical protein
MNLIQVAPREKYRLFLMYDDGVSGVVDLAFLAGRGVFSIWLEPGIFEAVALSEAGNPAWPGGVDLCPDALYMLLTGKRPDEVFPSLKTLPAHA